MEDNYAKILFRFHSDVLDEETIETMWAIIMDAEKGLYKIDSIPFYAPLIASNDIVFAEYDKDEAMLTYRETIEYSGNSIIQVVIMDKSVDIEDVRNKFKTLNCTSEKMNAGYFSMEIPYDISYKNVQTVLKELEKQEIIEYAEPCLSNKHCEDIA